ncbi:MAG: DUF5906 domain-containing protein [Ignavibacteriaceae bacterium]|nr:DUF5906 domain-containing protein [Ignavibacteriaceae bacterium]
MRYKIQITSVTDNDGAIAKKISWDGTKLIKSAQVSVKNGWMEAIEFETWEEYKDYLNRMSSNECLVLGHFLHGVNARLVGSKEAQDVLRNAFNRSLENFDWHEHFQLLCLDYDGAKDIELTPEQVIAIIDSVMPGFAAVKKVVKYSSSAHIYDEGGNLLSSSNGFHIYFMVNHPELIAEFFASKSAWLHKKLWLAGHGYIKNSRPKDRSTTAVTQMVRTIYDYAVFSPERIIFETAPVLGDGLHKDHLDAYIIEGPAEFLDLETYEPLSEQEDKEYSRIVSEAKKLNENTQYMIESRKLFKDHIKDKVESGAYKNRPEYVGLDTEEIAEREYRASQNAILMPDHAIKLTNGDSVTVETILNDRKKYHGAGCNDPHDPDYGNDNIAIIYSDQKVPVIFSHAHGGITYHLVSMQNNSPDFCSKTHCLEHFYLVVYNKKDDIYYIIGNKIDKYSYSGFTHKFGAYEVEVSNGNQTTKIPMQKWWFSNTEKKCIMGDGFNPDKPVVYEELGELLINEYRPDILRYGFETPAANEYERCALLWLTHIRTMIHNSIEAEIVIDFLAYLVQCPSERPMWALLITSAIRGVGKDMMTDIWAAMMGHKYARKASMKDLSEGNGWGDVYYRSKLIVVSECGSKTDRYTAGNDIKNAITTKTMTMNLKGKEVVFENVYAGLVFFSNHESPFRLDEGDRRFFVTRCAWSKEEADKHKEDGYFHKLASFYKDPVNLHGLYHYLLNRKIGTDLKGDAPPTATKEIMMRSEPNETEKFFVDIKKHPCKYWTKSMVTALFEKECDDLSDNNKQFKHFISAMFDAGKMKVSKKSQRLKTFSIEYATKNKTFIRENIADNWGTTTTSLHQCEEQSDDYLDADALKIHEGEDDQTVDSRFFSDCSNAPQFDCLE